ncbi:putative aminopeptidase YsdC [bioreactor metagenome]|uniref:Putative aminopeptidase YsdC n=1 Tax=bioreactor metagenome TaxID=1076179 RepID=A0A645D6G1_9ZZZZ
MDMLLKTLCDMVSPSGCEEKIMKLISKEAGPYADDMEKDGLGSLIVHKKGPGKKLALYAHADEIGFIATYIDDNGFVYFSALGGISVENIIRRAVIFTNGVRGVISYPEKIKVADLKINDCYIDIGTLSKEESSRLISIGQCATYEAKLVKIGQRVVGKAVDNRAGCFVLLEALKQIKHSEYDLYFIFTVQEEVGLRGAKTATYKVDPDIALAVDTTGSGDTPDGLKMDVKLSKGPAIKIKDGGVITHPKVKNWLFASAKKAGIPFQSEVIAEGSTDAGAASVSRGGVMSGGIAIPARYFHTAVESADLGDINGAVQLILSAVGTEMED